MIDIVANRVTSDAPRSGVKDPQAGTGATDPRPRPGSWYEPAVTRDDEIQAIVEVGRRTRARPPRGLWIAAALVGGICITGLAVALRGEPSRPATPEIAAPRPIPASPAARSGGDRLGTGLVVGAAGGLIAGFALARQRRADHSSRSRP